MTVPFVLQLLLMVNSVSSRQFRHTSGKSCFYCRPSTCTPAVRLEGSRLICHGTGGCGGNPTSRTNTRTVFSII